MAQKIIETKQKKIITVIFIKDIFFAIRINLIFFSTFVYFLKNLKFF